jgi:hypothetical protein
MGNQIAGRLAVRPEVAAGVCRKSNQVCYDRHRSRKTRPMNAGLPSK